MLIGYLLGALEADEVERVEQMLQDLESRRQLEILRLSLVPLEADRFDVEVPAQLAIRTCQRIHNAANAKSNSCRQEEK